MALEGSLKRAGSGMEDGIWNSAPYLRGLLSNHGKGHDSVHHVGILRKRRRIVVVRNVALKSPMGRQAEIFIQRP